MSKLQVNDLSPVKDSFAVEEQIRNLTEDQSKNIVGGCGTVVVVVVVVPV